MDTSIGKKIYHLITRILKWTLLVVIALIVIIPALLYIPWVQNEVKTIALDKVNASTGMNIQVGRLSLKFPLRVGVDDVVVLEATGDTMVTARSASLSVSPLALLKLNIDVKSVTLDNGFYQLGTPDSAMWLRAHIDRFDLDETDLQLKSGKIDVGHATVDGARVSLIMLDTITPTPVDTVASTPWLITAGKLELKNVDYRMQMLPTIDSLDCHVASAELDGGRIDMGSRSITVKSLDAALGKVLYLLPDAEWLASHPQRPVPVDTVATDSSSLWTITAGTLRLNADSAIYAMRGAAPLPGIDMNYLQVNDVEISVDSFYNRGTSITVPLTRLYGRERCGIALSASGVFSMENELMRADQFKIATDYSSVSLNAAMGVGDLTTDASLPLQLKLDGQLGLEDAELAMPSIVPMLRGVPRSPAILHADLDGTSGHINVKELSASIARFLSLEGSGEVSNPFDADRIDGKISLKVDAMGLNSIKPTLLEARLAKEINIPHTVLTGDITYSPRMTSGTLGIRSGKGNIGFKGNWVQLGERYKANLDVRKFPVASFMPSLGVGDVTASLAAEGKGLDFFKSGTQLNFVADVTDVVYMDQSYRNITMNAKLDEGQATGSLRSMNRDADIDMDFRALVADSGITWSLDGMVHNIDLGAMKITESAMQGSMGIKSEGSASADFKNIDAGLNVTSLKWAMPDMVLSTPEIGVRLVTSDSTVTGELNNGDLHARMAAGCGLDTLLARVTATSVQIDSIISQRNADIIALEQTLPPLAIIAEMGGMNNIAGDFLRDSKMSVNSARLSLSNDSLISMNANILGLISGSTRIDTLSVGVIQHGKYLAYTAKINNRRGTMDGFAHVTLSGFLGDDRVSALLRQSNIEGDQGFLLGLSAIAADSAVTVRFVPFTPTIGYKKWELNKDNFVTYNFVTRHIDADLTMRNENSSIRLYTEHDEAADSLGNEQEDVVMQLSDIHLSDWLAVSPFAPPVKGDLGADLRFKWNSNELTGTGVVSLTDLYYGRDRVGSFRVGLDVTNSANGSLHADASLLVDSVKVITARGHLNDTTAIHPFDLDFSMIHFPLHILNPFLPKDYARLSGMINGTMDITGSMIEPVFNGFIQFDSTAVNVGMLGSTFKFSDGQIPVDSNIVHFDGFAITAANDNPLSVNGTVDARKLSDVQIDLKMTARNMQIMNTNRARGGADAFGKAFINADVDVHGNMTLLNVDADLNLLQGTNVTYIMDDSGLAVGSQSDEEMVKFVNFSDTTQVLNADTISAPGMMMNLNAELTVSKGTTLNVYLNTDGSNRVSVQGDGLLSFNMNPQNNGRLIGRFNINGGNVRYSIPPVLSEKNFIFQEGSYVAFTGDMMNPQLNIKAVDNVKANIVQSGQNSRIVDFAVTLGVGGTLSALDLSFDLSTDNDITVQNELASMTPQQRASEAMNLLLTNVYNGPETRGSANLSGNPLYSFLTGRLNAWAAKTIKGVDLSFGMNQYETTTDGSTGTTTSYSYSVSKSLFNDRFKIVVGGNYSTDDNVDENFSQNLISDISFEYVINKSGSMYVRLFRHTGYESILEGEVTQTGVGFVYKKKVGSIRDVFRFLRHLRPRKKTVAEAVKPEEPSETPSNVSL